MSDPASHPAPLIVTLMLDAVAQARFDALRQTHFPPERLHVGAHVTLFHALPGEREAAVAQAVAQACAATPQFPVMVAGLRLLGHGVAYALAAAEAEALRARLRSCFAGWLTAQDQARWAPHVTVQNKVAADVARKTKALLADAPFPHPVTATGLALWRYRGGPWEAVVDHAFAPAC